MRIGVLGAALALAGCATSAAGLKKGQVEKEWSSAREPKQVAGCLASKLVGSNPVLEEEDEHFVVVRNNGYGLPMVRFDIFKRDGATRVELRSTLGFGRGADKLESCL